MANLTTLLSRPTRRPVARAVEGQEIALILVLLALWTALSGVGVALGCAYAAPRLVLRVREAVAAVRARSLEAQRAAAQAREAAKAESRDARAPRAAGRAR